MHTNQDEVFAVMFTHTLCATIGKAQTHRSIYNKINTIHTNT